MIVCETCIECIKEEIEAGNEIHTFNVRVDHENDNETLLVKFRDGQEGRVTVKQGEMSYLFIWKIVESIFRGQKDSQDIIQPMCSEVFISDGTAIEK